MITSNQKSIKEQTIELIDALKSTCQTYGMGNDGNEYKIITQVFLYKFINDKFGYEVRRINKKLADAPQWELAYAEGSRLFPGNLRPRDISCFRR